MNMVGGVGVVLPLATSGLLQRRKGVEYRSRARRAVRDAAESIRQKGPTCGRLAAIVKCVFVFWGNGTVRCAIGRQEGYALSEPKKHAEKDP